MFDLSLDEFMVKKASNSLLQGPTVIMMTSLVPILNVVSRGLFRFVETYVLGVFPYPKYGLRTNLFAAILSRAGASFRYCVVKLCISTNSFEGRSFDLIRENNITLRRRGAG